MDDTNPHDRSGGDAGVTDGRGAIAAEDQVRGSRPSQGDPAGRGADPVVRVDPEATMTGLGRDAQAGAASRGSACEPGDTPASPCVSVCALDENDVCMGCYRTATEITDWFMASASEKRTILRAAEARRSADSPIRLL